MIKYRTKIRITNFVLLSAVCLALLQPAAMDIAEQIPAKPASSRIYLVSGFADFGNFMSMLGNWLSSFRDSINPFVESTVAAVEKHSVVKKELKQSELNYDAALLASETGTGSIDQISNETSDACQFIDDSKQTVEAKQNEGMLARALTAAHSQRGLYISSSSVEAKRLLAGSMGAYCSEESYTRGLCTGAVSVKGLPDADVQAVTIFDSSEASGTYNKEEYSAASKFVSWSTDPIPLENLPITIEKTSAGQNYLVEARRRQSILSSSQYALNRIVAARHEKK